MCKSLSLLSVHALWFVITANQTQLKTRDTEDQDPFITPPPLIFQIPPYFNIASDAFVKKKKDENWKSTQNKCFRVEFWRHNCS